VARETLLLIDGHALVFRAFFAMPALTNSRGEMTNAVYGFTSMLLKALNEHHPAYAIAAFDPPGPTFRHEEFAAYKAQRPPAPSELVRQMPWSREVVKALNMPIIELPGFEADDVIGTLSRKAEAAGLDVLIVTGDLDALQLVTPHVRVYATRRGITDTVVYDVDKVFERYGFDPPKVVDFKALRGDASDNIPGVPGIGDKTAMALVQQYGELEQILAAVPSMKEGRVKRALEEHREQAILSKRMATIVGDLDVPLDIESAQYLSYDRERVIALFEELEFRSLVPRLPFAGAGGGGGGNGAAAVAAPTLYSQPQPSPAAAGSGQGELFSDAAAAAAAVAPPPDAASVEVVRDPSVMRDVAEHLREASGVAVRTVVDEPARHGIVAGVALAALDDPSHAWYVPVGHQVLDGSAPDETVAVVTSLLADPDVRKTAYDVKREILAWRRNGVVVRGFDFDLLLAAYLLNQRTRVPPLPQLAHDLVGASCDAEDTVLGTGKGARRPTDLDVEEAATCYGLMTALSGPVRTVLERDMQSIDVRRLHDEMELPVALVLAEMELLGIAVDPDQLEVLRDELEARIQAIEAEVFDCAGYTFNIASTQQLAKFLYDDLGLASGRRTKTGRSTDADTLEALRTEHPMVEKVLEHRQLTKLKGTYVDALPQLVERDGRVHTSYSQAVAATGRLSSSDPNLQNVPVRSEVGQRIRGAFVARDDAHVLLSADYSQIELRVLAHVTEDPALLEAFQRGEDIHTTTASIVYGVAREEVTRDMRRNAKVVNFGLVYGLSEFGLSRDTGMSREDSAAFIERYFANFASVTRWLEQTREQVRKWGYVETIFGRRRYIPDVLAANRGIRQAAERMAVNMPIQGAAADIMKFAMIRVDRALHESGMEAHQLLQVHDELVLETPRDEVVALVPLLREAMGGAADLRVPLDVDVKVGHNWSAMTPLLVAAKSLS
jgi:DNA polymerase-1